VQVLKLCAVLKCECNLQPSVSHPWTQVGVTLQKFRSPAKKWKVDHKNLIHSKSKQLHFNVVYSECDLK